MGSNGVLVESQNREIQQVVGLLLGQDQWGAKIAHTSFDSDTEFAHTIRNLGSGGHLNIGRSTDAANLLNVTDTTTTIRTLTVTNGIISSGDLTVDGRLIMSAAAAKIVGGATSIAFRDSTDAVDNLLVTNTGSVTVRAGLTVTTGPIAMAEAVSRLVPGATSFAIRNNVNTLDNLLVTDAGAVTTRAGVTVSTGNATLTTGALIFGAANSAIIPGATNLSLRNNANTFDNLLVSDAGAVTVRNGFTVSAGGASIAAGLTVSTGGVIVTTNNLVVSAGNIEATAGDLVVTAGKISMAAAESRLVPGATSFAVRNNANGADNLLVTDAGAVTTRSALTVTTGGATISAGSLTLGDTASKIVPGATSLSHRNHADSADNLLISDAGAVTVRNGFTVTTGGATVTAGGLTVTAGGLTVTAGTAALNGGGTATTFTATTYLASGATPATTGAVRLPNNDGVYARNAANNANLQMMVTDTSNNMVTGNLTNLNNHFVVSPNTLDLWGGGTSRMSMDSTGIGFFAQSPVARQSIGSGSTDLATVITLANNIRSALNNLGLTQT